jgi:hypothetical protein
MEGEQPKRSATKPTEKSVLSESATFSCLTNETLSPLVSASN